MNAGHIPAEVLGEIARTRTAAEDREAFRLALECEIDIERFDRSQPGHWFCNDEWIPTDRALCSAMCKRRRQRCADDAARARVTEDAMRATTAFVQRMSFAQQERELERMRRAR